MGTSTRRAGFTLFELVVVMAIIVAFAAVAWTTFDRVLVGEALRHGADQVRAAWTRARVTAIESGVAQAWIVQPETGAFAIEPWAEASDGLDPSTVTLPLRVEQLPAGVVIERLREQVRANLAPASTAGAPSASGTLPPVVFHADGTTSSVQLVLRDGHGQYIVLELRGLTAAVTSSDLLTAEELPP